MYRNTKVILILHNTGVYNQGILNYCQEQQNHNIKMERSRSRSPINRKGGGKITKGKEYRVYVNNLTFEVELQTLKDYMMKSKFI